MYILFSLLRFRPLRSVFAVENGKIFNLVYSGEGSGICLGWVNFAAVNASLETVDPAPSLLSSHMRCMSDVGELRCRVLQLLQLWGGCRGRFCVSRIPK